MQRAEKDEVLGKLHKIENLLEKKKLKPLNTVETSRYLSISLSHLYKLTSQRKIPFHKPNGKHLYFFVDELDEWITSTPLSGRTSTFQQSSMTTPLSNQVSDDKDLGDEEIEPP